MSVQEILEDDSPEREPVVLIDEMDNDSIYNDPDDGLQERYDLILLGTGLVESIVACAAARIGKSVLHLDKCNYYGRECTGSSLEQFLTKCRSSFEETLASE